MKNLLSGKTIDEVGREVIAWIDERKEFPPMQKMMIQTQWISFQYLFESLQKDCLIQKKREEEWQSGRSR